MSNGQKIVDIATKEIGYKEGLNKNNIYGLWFGLNNVSWCAEFVSWCYAQAGFPLGIIDYMKGYASVPFGLKHFTTSNEITNYPQAGDIVIYDWNGDGNPDHTGIFVCGNGDGTFTAIEGNTSDGNASDGGTVQKKIRKYTLVEAFVHPKVLDIIS